ncbi:MAG: hypothetical protein IH872_06045 [Chloroflexi bacterium]|nr:hypothetical protein [Chloroflexota bacterium]
MSPATTARPESQQLSRVQLMADTSPQARSIAQLRAMAGGGADVHSADNRPESSQLERLRSMTHISFQSQRIAQLATTGGDPRTVGTGVGWLIRDGVNGLADSIWGIGFGWHEFETSEVALGQVTEFFYPEVAFNLLRNAPVLFTVPGAIRGSGTLLGPREEGGMACAFLGGPVVTTSDYAALTITNAVLEGHLFGGTIRQQIWERGGQVMTKVVGRGFGNFASINAVAGRLLFDVMLQAQKAYIYVKTLMNPW